MLEILALLVVFGAYLETARRRGGPGGLSWWLAFWGTWCWAASLPCCWVGVCTCWWGELGWFWSTGAFSFSTAGDDACPAPGRAQTAGSSTSPPRWFVAAATQHRAAPLL